MILRATRNREIHHLHTINLCEDTLKASSDLTLKYAEGVGWFHNVARDKSVYEIAQTYLLSRTSFFTLTFNTVFHFLLLSLSGIIINGGRRITSFPSNTPFTAENQAFQQQKHMTS